MNVRALLAFAHHCAVASNSLILDIPFDEKPSAHRPEPREGERAAA